MSDLVELLRNEAFNGLGCPSLYSDAADEIERLRSALQKAVAVAEEAAREWDAAPNGMKAGKLLLSLCGHVKGYREDITAIHKALEQKP